jgi:CubicO group peptidase (beta-lactamase class C family)
MSTKAAKRRFSLAILALCLGVSVATYVDVAAQSTYYPPAGAWAKKAPAELGLDPVLLQQAIDYAKSRESNREMDFSDQERIFGTLLGSVPNIRAHTNGVVIYKGYVVAEFGDTTWIDPTYSVAKSMLSTVMGVAIRDGKITNLDEPVNVKVKDGGYESPRNAQITWKHHLQQVSEWEGNMWGKQDNFIGKEAFGDGEMKPREQMKPGTYYEYNDVRINRFALSLLRVFNKSVPDVFRDEIMNPIGASNTWRWIPYHNSWVEVPRQCPATQTTPCTPRRLMSVSGGTRWGGGVWINSMDMARFGYLWLRNGKWGDKQIIPAAYVKEALTQGGAPNSPGNGYGYLWWLNTSGKALAGLPTNAFSANGAGSNTITVSPDHDLVVVWRWHQGSAGEFARRVIAAIKPGTM